MARAPADKAAAQQDKAPVRKPDGRNLVILCDGTGNELGGALSDEISDIRISNVLKLYRIAEKGKRQLVHYSPGVGTIGRVDWLYRWKQKALAVLGLAMGYGLDANVLGAYRFLVENWQEGDRIYIFGFSRGAWTARVLAGFLHLVGLVRPSQLNMCDNALATYKRAAKEDKLPIAWHFAKVIGALPGDPFHRRLGYGRVGDGATHPRLASDDGDASLYADQPLGPHIPPCTRAR